MVKKMLELELMTKENVVESVAGCSPFCNPTAVHCNPVNPCPPRK